MVPTDDEIADMMQWYGGGFVAKLGDLFQYASAENRAILKAAFPHYWAQYADLVILKADTARKWGG
jgi:hypothetical protein